MQDLTALDDLDPYAAENASPFDDFLQDCYHRLLEDPGSNPDDPDRGLGLQSMLSGPLDPQIKTRIEHELKKDSRTEAVAVALTQTEDTAFRIDIQIQANGRTLGLVIESDGTSFRRVS